MSERYPSVSKFGLGAMFMTNHASKTCIIENPMDVTHIDFGSVKLVGQRGFVK